MGGGLNVPQPMGSTVSHVPLFQWQDPCETLSEAPPYNQLRSLDPHSRKRVEAGIAPTTQTPLTTHQDSLAALSKFTSWLESIITRIANMPRDLREPTNKLVNNKKMLELYFPELSQNQTKMCFGLSSCQTHRWLEVAVKRISYMIQNCPEEHGAEVIDKMESLCLAKLWADPSKQGLWLSGSCSQRCFQGVGRWEGSPGTQSGVPAESCQRCFAWFESHQN